MNLVPDMKKLFSFGVFFLFAVLSAAEPADFPFYKDIELPGKTPDLISSFKVDAEMYRNLGDMNGFRVYSPDGAFCPFSCDWAVSNAFIRPVRRHFEAKINRFETLPDGSVRITLSAFDRGSRNAIPIEGITIRTSAKDFDKKVKVYSPDLGDGLVAEGAFLDYSSRIDLRNNYIAFSSPVRSYELVVVIENYAETKDSPLSRVVQGDTNIVEQYKVREEPKIDGISLTCIGENYEVGKVKVETPIEILSQESRSRTTVVKFSNGFAPLGELEIRSADAFFFRPYRLLDEAGNIVAHGTIRMLESGSFRTSRTERIIELDGRRSKSWTLELDNGENGELKDITLIASGPVHQVRFLSKIQLFDPETVEKSDGKLFPSYRVYYGADGLPAPENPFADAMNASPTTIDAADLSRPGCTLSAQQSNPAFRTPVGGSRSWGIVYKVLMAAAALAVLMILVFSVKGVEKIKE